MTLFRLACVCLIASLPSFAFAGPIVPDTLYQVLDHPDGNAAPPTYWLRLDDIAGTPTTFTNEHPEADVTLIWDADQETIRISGITFGGSVDNGVHGSDAALWSFDMLITGVQDSGNPNVLDPADVLSVFGDPDGTTGTITNLDTQQSFSLDLYPPDDDSFFLAFGHRGVDDQPSGWGWIAVDGYRYKTNDFLFRVVEAPEPGGALLLGMTLLTGLAVRRRS